MSFSINTNAASLDALRSMNATQRSLNNTQTAINTGLKVASAKDNAAVYSIAQKLRADLAGYNAVMDSVDRGISTVDVALAGGGLIADILLDMKERAIMFADAASSAEREAILIDYNKLQEQITTIVDNAGFNGTNLLKGQAVPTVFGSFMNALDKGGKGVADVNNDGLDDIIAASNSGLASGDLILQESNGDNTFTRNQSASVGNLGGADAIGADLDGDGVVEILSPYLSTTSIIARQPDGSYAHVDQIQAKGVIEAGDIQNDGSTDIVILDSTNSGEIEIFQGNGSLTYANTPDQTLNFVSGAIKDFKMLDINGDSYVDIVAAGDDGSGNGRIETFLNDGSGNFASNSVITSTNLTDFWYLEVGDMDANDTLDIFVAQPSSSSIERFEASKTGALSIVELDSNSFNTIRDIDLADFNNDGILDVMVGDNDGLFLISGTAEGGLALAENMNVGSFSGHPEVDLVTAGDFNGDGLIDVAVMQHNDVLKTALSEIDTASDLNGSIYAVNTNPDGNESYTFCHEPMTLTSLGLDTISLSGDVFGAIRQIDTAIEKSALKLGRLGSAARRLELIKEQALLNNDTLAVGIGNLVDANMAKASAALQALQVKQQLGIQALQIANNNPQSIVSLFQS